MKKNYRYLPILIGILAFGYLYGYQYVYLNNKYFYDNPINAKIIRVENYYNKSLQFFYTNKYCISTFNTESDTLKIGDSISKKSLTNEFSVFKKVNGKYRLVKKYYNK